MMPRKTRRMIMIATIIMIVLVIIVTLVFLYINTDMFKSSSTLFTKYLGQNVENMDSFYQEATTSEYDEMLQQKKYKTESQIKVNYTENIGTTSENTENSINQLKLKISGQTDKSNQYNYQAIQLLNREEGVAKVEYVQNGNTYGIKFSDLFNQYVSANNENLKELFSKLGYTEEQLENIPDTIEFEQDIKNIFEFSKEEREKLKKKYISIVSSSVSKDNFSKQKNQTIQINEKNIKANSYILTISKEELNNIYIKILEEMKQDEIILSKIDKLQSIGKNFQLNERETLREKFVMKIESLITEISRNNIGNDKVKVIVYEDNQTTIRTFIQHPDYEIKIDLLASDADDYIQMSYQNTINKEEKGLTYKKNKGETSVVFTHVKNGETTQYSLLANEKVEGNHCSKDMVIKYEQDSHRLEMKWEKEIDVVDNFDNEITMNAENSANLSQMEAEQVQAIWSKVNTSVSQKIDEITTVAIKMEDLWKVAKSIGIVSEQQTLEAMGITETEKNRFNSQFEILQGEELESGTVLNLIDAIQENLVELEIVSNKELKLKLDRFNKNEDVANTMRSFIEENKNRKYNAKVEYDEGTGLVCDILLTLLEK